MFLSINVLVVPNDKELIDHTTNGFNYKYKLLIGLENTNIYGELVFDAENNSAYLEPSEIDPQMQGHIIQKLNEFIQVHENNNGNKPIDLIESEK
jgi:hypothetical protein